MQGGLTFKFDKIPLIYSASYFNWGGLGALFGRAKPTKASVATGLVLPCTILRCPKRALHEASFGN